MLSIRNFTCRMPNSAFGTCRFASRSAQVLPFPPPPPLTACRHCDCSAASQVLWENQTSPDRPCMGYGTTFPCRSAVSIKQQRIRRSHGSRSESFHTCRVLGRRGGQMWLVLAPHSMLPSASYDGVGPPIQVFRRSTAGLHVPLSTLRQQPHGYLRMTRGKRGSLLLRYRVSSTPAL